MNMVGQTVLIKPLLKLGIIVAELGNDEYVVIQVGGMNMTWYHKNHIIAWTKQNQDAFDKTQMKFFKGKNEEN